MKLNELVNLYGGDARLVLRNADGITASPLRYSAADEGVYNENDDLYHLLSQNNLHDIEQNQQEGDLDFFSLIVVDL